MLYKVLSFNSLDKLLQFYHSNPSHQMELFTYAKLASIYCSNHYHLTSDLASKFLPLFEDDEHSHTASNMASSYPVHREAFLDPTDPDTIILGGSSMDDGSSDEIMDISGIEPLAAETMDPHSGTLNNLRRLNGRTRRVASLNAAAIRQAREY